jgi:chromosome segregation ATPase
VYFSNIEELERRQEEHQEQLRSLAKAIEVNQSTQSHLESKLQQQSHKIMANFIARAIHSSTARGFYTWLDNLREGKSK